MCSTSETLNLFNVNSVKELKYLLSIDSDINQRNCFGETPLLTAVRNGKDIDLIEELVNCGADVNSKDEWQVSALYSAITKRTKDLKLVKLLLDNGAEIKGEKPVPDRALEHIFIHSKLCTKLLIKYKFLKYHDLITYPIPEENRRNTYQCYKSVVDVNVRPYCYDYYDSYLDQCGEEVVRMKTVWLCRDKTLLDFVSKRILFENLDGVSVNRMFYELDSHEYFAYRGMIAGRIGRKNLLNTIEDLLFQRQSQFLYSQPMCKTLVNSDLMYHVAQFLHKVDILNFVIALQVSS